MKLRKLLLAGLFVLPISAVMLSSSAEEGEAYRPSGRRPQATPIGLPAMHISMPATPETAITIALRNIPDSAVSRTYSIDATAELVVVENGSQTLAVDSGVHEAIQEVAPGWILDDIRCDDLNSTVDVAMARADFMVEGGENVTCHFTNKVPSTLFYSSFESGDDSEWGAPVVAYCADSCGGPSPAGCWCDDRCVDAGDCCPDVCLTCGFCG